MAQDARNTDDDQDGGDSNPPQTGRRSFLKAATVAVGGAIGAALIYPLARYIFFPVRAKTVTGPDRPIDVMAASQLQAGAEPVKVDLVSDAVRNAWTVSDKVTLGSAWVSKRKDGTVVALSSECPHLGCAVHYSAADGEFRCPCHRSSFDRDGKRKGGPAKRGLDPLPVKVVDGRVTVRFVRYRQDVPDREPV